MKSHYCFIGVLLFSLWACNKKKDDVVPVVPTPTDTTVIAPSRQEQQRVISASVDMQQQVDELTNSFESYLRNLSVGSRLSAEIQQGENCWIPTVVSRGANATGGYDSLIVLEYNCSSMKGKIKVYFNKGKRWAYNEEVEGNYKDSVIYENIEWRSQMSLSKLNGYRTFEVTGRRLIDSVWISQEPNQEPKRGRTEQGSMQSESVQGYWSKRYAGTSRYGGKQEYFWAYNKDTANSKYSYSGTTTYTADSVVYSSTYNSEWNNRKYTGESKDITTKSSCHNWFPVKGTNAWKFTDKDGKITSMTVDYGDGTCDRKLTITYGDGSTETKDYDSRNQQEEK